MNTVDEEMVLIHLAIRIIRELNLPHANVEELETYKSCQIRGLYGALDLLAERTPSALEEADKILRSVLKRAENYRQSFG